MGSRLASTEFKNTDRWSFVDHSVRRDIYDAKLAFYRTNRRQANVLRITANQRIHILANESFQAIIPKNASLLEPDCMLMRMKIKIVTSDPGVSWEPPPGN